MTPELRPTVVAHDAGGAAILASLVARKSMGCNFVLGGPAIEIFEQRLARGIPLVPLKKALEVSSEFLTGTGWSSDLEYSAICSAKKKGIFTRSFLDHWVNYESRFTRDGLTCIPDELMVGDEHALEISRVLFPGVPIVLETNPYFLDIQETARSLNPAKTEQEGITRILYVAEPINPNRGFTEWERLSFFLDFLANGSNQDFSVTIRPHPAEDHRKYEHYEQMYSFVRPYSRSSLFDQIASHQIVVGCETMAMAVAVHFGKLVFSALPRKGSPCVIPLPGIRPLPRSADSILRMARSH